jgi:hypothetical protein
VFGETQSRSHSTRLDSTALYSTPLDFASSKSGEVGPANGRRRRAFLATATVGAGVCLGDGCGRLCYTVDFL